VNLYILCRTPLPDKYFITIIRLGTHARERAQKLKCFWSVVTKRLKVEGSEKFGAMCSEVKWCEVKWSEVMCSEVKWSDVMCSEVKWCVVKWSDDLGWNVCIINYLQLCRCTSVPCSTLCVSLLFASLCYFLITGRMFYNIIFGLFSYFVFLFYISCISWLCIVFVLFCVSVLLMYRIAVSFLFLYKSTDRCRRVYTQSQ
jgi:hypothetical protein